MSKLLIVFLLFLFTAADPVFAQIFPSSLDKRPPAYTGKVFQLSQDYPKKPLEENYQPWLNIDFRKDPLKYVEVVYQYIIQGNVECDWVLQDNKIRNWYHVPWMHWNLPKDGQVSREYINGLTRERDSRPFELSKNQYDFKQNWAIGFYNEPGGYTIGKVWENPLSPDPSKAKFAYGTVCGKLLYTETDTITAPWLAGAPECQAYIHVSVNEKNKKEVRTLRLLQFDIAVRDPRADSATGWVFGTLIYDAFAPGSDPWMKMVPAGAIWGNDAGITPESVLNGNVLKETYTNPVFHQKFKFGWAGRLNGPVDNPNSSCVSCHSTAQYPMLSSQSPGDNASVPERIHWFRKTQKGGEPFTSGATALDYSMQLAMGIEHFYLYQNLNVTEKSSIWMNRVSTFTRGGYLFIFVALLLSFWIITKSATTKFRIKPFISIDEALLLLRAGIGIMFMIHGSAKITGGPATWTRLGQSMANFGIYMYPEWWGFLAAVAEFVCSILLITGLFFRPAVAMLCINMLVATLKHVRSNDSIENASHAIEALCIFIFLFLAGPGRYALDKKLFKKNDSTTA